LPPSVSNETIEWAAHPDRKYLYLQNFNPFSAAVQYLNYYREIARTRYGYDATSAQLGFGAPVYIADTDEQAMAEARPHIEHLFNKMQRRYVISGTVQARLRRFGGIQSDVLYPPPPKRDYRHESYGNYLFGVSRLSPLKRFDLVLRALAEPVAAGIRFVIAGEGAEMERLKDLAVQLGIEDRVKFAGRLSDQEMIDHFARCRGVVFPPFNEDYGFVTVEAFMCGRPVITCTDSGGPSELVRDGVELVPSLTHIVGHDGDSLGGMVASLMTFPEHGLVVSVISNISYADTFGVGVKIAQAFAEHGRAPARK